MNLQHFLFGVYPYIALVVFLFGSWVRFDREQYTWKSDSSQLLSNKDMRLASNLFHIGIIAIFFGHAVGLLTPHSWFLAMGISDLAHQYIAIVMGSVFGAICLAGGAMLWLRRMNHPRIRATSRLMDIVVLSWLLITLMLGLLTIPFSLYHALHGDAGTMLSLTEWVQSVVALRANPALLEDVGFFFKLHLFFGMTVFLLFPFSRLVHIWSAPFGYLGRAYQIVRTKRVSAR